MTKYDQRIGYAIRQQRIKKAMSQERLASVVGITRGHLSRVERGERNCSIELLAELCKALGVSPKRVMPNG